MSHPKTPPSLPKVSDEAGDTPLWVPVLGLFLFCLGALVVLAMNTGSTGGTAPDAAAHERQAEDAAAEAAPGAGPADGAP